MSCLWSRLWPPLHRHRELSSLSSDLIIRRVREYFDSPTPFTLPPPFSLSMVSLSSPLSLDSTGRRRDRRPLSSYGSLCPTTVVVTFIGRVYRRDLPGRCLLPWSLDSRTERWDDGNRTESLWLYVFYFSSPGFILSESCKMDCSRFVIGFSWNLITYPIFISTGLISETGYWWWDSVMTHLSLSNYQFEYSQFLFYST